MSWRAALVVAILLSGCATKYQEMGLTGGVMAEPVMTNVYRIVAHGNGYTSVDRVQDFALMKAAETTISVGGNYFLVISEADRTNVSIGQTAGVANTSIVGHTAFTTYTPGAAYHIVKPGESVLIRVLRIPAGQAPPAGAFPAHDIVKTMGPRLKPKAS